MSLVAYGGSSDEEEENGDQEDGGGQVILLARDAGTKNGKSASESATILKLPQPVAAETIQETQDEFLKKKEEPTEKPSKQPVKITVPSLVQFDSDDDDDAKEKASKSAKESGLLGMLPPPKGIPLSNKSFVPQVLKRKPKASGKQKKRILPKLILIEKSGDSGDSDDEDIPEMFNDAMWQKACQRKIKPQKRTIAETQSVGEGSSTNIDIAPEVPAPYDGLDNEAFKQLVGSSKRRRENIKLIDINEEEVTADKDLWLTKSLTDPEMVPMKEPEEEPVDSTRRRKHHISYLVQQAKANEEQLQTQWAKNKYNRKQNQSKYGF